MKNNVLKGQLKLVVVDDLPEKNNNNYLKERVDEYGIDNLMDSEVISLLTGISVNTLKDCIDSFGLAEFSKYTATMKLSKAQRRKLDLLLLYYKRMLSAGYKDKPILDSSSKAGSFVINLFVDKAYECFYLLCLDTQNRLNYASLVHQGTINESPVYPRIIIEEVLKYRANSVILAHNHPGGSLKPSLADINSTKNIKLALDAIQVKLIDHIIVGENIYNSFAENGLLP